MNATTGVRRTVPTTEEVREGTTGRVGTFHNVILRSKHGSNDDSRLPPPPPPPPPPPFHVTNLTPGSDNPALTSGGAGTWGHEALSSGAVAVAAAATVASANVTNLTYIGGTDLWVVAASVSGALQPYVSLLTVNTRDMSAPAFLLIGPDKHSPALYVGAVAVDVASSLGRAVTPGGVRLVTWNIPAIMDRCLTAK
jgi:hypothetical protein